MESHIEDIESNTSMEVINNDNQDIDELDKIIKKINLDVRENEVKRLYNNDFKPKKTPEYITLYEYTSIIGQRASQIQDNAPILITDYNKDDSPIEIAKKELKAGKICFIIERPLPNGQIEHVRLDNLLLKEDL
jgi:DNA-directed RNA polymerases I, II, and III subunit RPABC2